MAYFWQQLMKPIFCLAPMEQVTDFAFREMFARYSGQGPGSKNQKPKRNGFVMFTEFVNVDGLLHPEGRKKLEIDLKYSEAQRPIVAQLWGRDPEKFRQAAQIVAELGFDGVDINMGCPQSKEIQIGACAALIREPKLAQEIIEATKEGASSLPVSVKTRIGYSKPEEMEEWVKTILETEPAALILHGRTKKEMSKVLAHWDKIAEAVEIRNKLQVTSDKSQKTLIIGNGDIKSYQEGLDRVRETGVDGVMVGRGAFGDPWFFSPGVVFASDYVVQARGLPVEADIIRPSEDGKMISSPTATKQGEALHYITIRDRLHIMLEHAELFDRMFKGVKSFVIMRKHFKAYCSGFPGAAELRAKLMETKNLEETKKITQEYLRDIDRY